MSPLLLKSARRSVLVGQRGPGPRRCQCWDCSTTKTKGGQRALERRQWMRDEVA